MTKISLILAATGALVLAGCHHGGRKGHYGADTAKITEEIKAKEAQWQKEYAAKNLDALAGEYEKDAALAGPGEPLATSEAERRRALQGLTSDPNLQLTFSSDHMVVANSGDLASSRGHYTLIMTDKATNRPVTGNGSFLTVYRKQEDGSWKAVEDFITPGPAPAPAAK